MTDSRYSAADNLIALRTDVTKTTNVLKVTIEKLVDRDDRLDVLTERAHDLSASSHHFHDSGRHVQQRMKWKNRKLTIFISRLLNRNHQSILLMAISQLSPISESFEKLQNPVEVPIPYETQISKKSVAALSERSCTVCLELKPIQEYEVYASTNCSHPTRTICDICMYEYVRNTWNIAIDIQCPECSAPLPHVTVKQILICNDDDALYERFAKLNLDRSLEQHPEFIWCAHGCGSGQLNEGGTMNMTV
ncbi:unnamed protein product, partial [Adineta ricciae]